ncbi:MAG: quinone-dependent dihydroorotate dehydrogenase [Cytophagaceae bacterium]|jgi:dihydroorotate dehydrogenase|nr:quinone-dependent dihydroorotate dehydrogenase [Cytophagaceae bacterium]
MYSILRSWLFKKDAETAHHTTFRLLKTACSLPGMPSLLKTIYCVNDPALAVEVAGLRFPNPVGLAAGLDKDAKMIDEFSCLGFGFIEIGTLTPKPQPGNEAPRLFRLLPDEAIINRMGFNNEGVVAAVERLKNRKSDILVGGNIGKNKVTENDKATEDYLIAFEALFPWVDYFVVNVSSPNTPGLRDLQDKEPLQQLLNTLQKKNKEKAASKPIFLKIAPDLSNSQLDDIIDIIRQTGIAGVIATNTTIQRQGLKTGATELEAIGNGGLSGKPLRERSTEVIRYLSEKSGRAFPIIGVGGIHHAEDALEKLQAGASLVQLYTGFIYEGPALITKILKRIQKQKH